MTAATGADRAITASREPIDAAMHWIATAMEIVGVAVIVTSALVAAGLFLHRGSRAAGWTEAYECFRAELGRGILLGLEFLVAADIIGTVAVAPTFESLGVLAAIVLIRTFLSFSLAVEIEGRWPWQRRPGTASDTRPQPEEPS
jgi:uncharacterized membrane protein